MTELKKKRVGWLTLALALVFVQCYTTRAQKVTSSRNYLINGGFESEPFLDWTRADLPAHSVAERETVDVTGGRFGLRLENSCAVQSLLLPDEFPFLFECRAKGDIFGMRWTRKITNNSTRPDNSGRRVLKDFRSSEFTYVSTLITDMKSNFTNVVVEICAYDGLAYFDQCSVRKVKRPSRFQKISEEVVSYTENRNPYFEMGSASFWRLGKGATISDEDAVVGYYALKLSGRGARASQSFILEAVSYVYTFSCNYKGPRDPQLLIIRKRYNDLIARRDPDPETSRVYGWKRISIAIALPRYDEYEFIIKARPEDTTYVDDCSLVREAYLVRERRIFFDEF
ncbi:hypothetical protein NDN08_004878 [Rhodosorus marinus]|uniref:NADH:ubiquinone oxidoreductase intermediate-associated protein 30 domain-containing protein n=1 Tax=Rhodosorus marinus TaxID=101924 RepID=A0AAV8UK47_9RHOD|nr:hypothetical protein NDN08_004878 [Rhodosorus marinus]